MAINRVTFNKTMWSKLATQANKKDNADLAQMLKEAKKTNSPSGDTIIWEPSQALIKRMHAVLVHEEGFTRDRQKGGVNHTFMKQQIAKLASLIEPEVKTE